MDKDQSRFQSSIYPPQRPSTLLPGAAPILPQGFTPMQQFNKQADPGLQQQLQQLMIHLGGLGKPALSTMSPSAAKPQNQPELRPILGGGIGG